MGPLGSVRNIKKEIDQICNAALLQNNHYIDIARVKMRGNDRSLNQINIAIS